MNDALVALKHVPPETQAALDFALHISQRYPEYTIVHAGHSLGGEPRRHKIQKYFKKSSCLAGSSN